MTSTLEDFVVKDFADDSDVHLNLDAGSLAFPQCNPHL